MARGPLAAGELLSYDGDGFTLAAGLFDAREIAALRRASTTC